MPRHGANTGWGAESRSLALGRLSRRGRVRLFALVTARAQHQQLCWHARGAVVRRRQVDRGLAAGPSAIRPEVVGANNWLKHRNGWHVDVGGALWQIGHDICPAFFEADLKTKVGQEQWRQELGVPYDGFPASALDSSDGRADAVRMELLRAAMRGCNILFQGMRSRGGCGRRLPNYEAYGLADEKDAEDFLTEVCDLLKLSEEDVFDIWSVEASVAGCDFGKLLYAERSVGITVEYSEVTSDGTLATNSVYRTREETLRVGREWQMVLRDVIAHPESGLCYVAWLSHDGMQQLRPLLITAADLGPPPAGSKSKGYDVAVVSSLCDWLEQPLQRLCAELHWAAHMPGRYPGAAGLSTRPHAIGATSLRETVNRVYSFISHLHCGHDQCCGVGFGGMGWDCKSYGAGTMWGHTP